MTPACTDRGRDSTPGVGDRHRAGAAPRVRHRAAGRRRRVVMHDATSFGTKPRIAAEGRRHLRGARPRPDAASLVRAAVDASCAASPGSRTSQDVPDELRGTYAGAGHMAKYLRALGFTAIELLPVHEFANDLNPEGSPGWDRARRRAAARQLLGIHDLRLLRARPPLRLRQDRRAGRRASSSGWCATFHDAGLEVYLDVVYNHTGEGGLWDGTGDTAELLSLPRPRQRRATTR